MRSDTTTVLPSGEPRRERGRVAHVDAVRDGNRLSINERAVAVKCCPIRAQYFNPGANASPFAECAEYEMARLRNALRVVLAVSENKVAIHPADLLFER